MNLRELFKSADNVLEGSSPKPVVDHKSVDKSVGARKRISVLADAASFKELFGNLESENLLSFPDYDDKLKRARQKSGEKEAVLCGEIEIGQMPCCIFAMDANFMMGSMGTVVGEKITLLFEYATKNKLPVIGITVSGGARMQEGMLSLMQMAKVSGAVKRHSNAGLLYVVLLTNPTTGGVEASFAMEGDVILAEPNALIGFAGPRLIQQTLKKKLPKGFQRSEALLKCGFVDQIVAPSEQRDYLEKLLRLHRGGIQNDQV